MGSKGYVSMPIAIGTPIEGGHAGIRRFSALDINADPGIKDKYKFHCPDCGPEVTVHHVKQSAPYIVSDRGKTIERATHFALNPGVRHTNPDCQSWEQNLEAMQRDGKPIQRQGDKWIITLSSIATQGLEREIKEIALAHTTFSRAASSTKRLDAKDMAKLDQILYEIHPDFSNAIFDRVQIRIGSERTPVRDIWFNSLEDTKQTYRPEIGSTPNKMGMLRVMIEEGVKSNSLYSYARGSEETILVDGKRYTVQPEIRTNDPSVLECLMQAERLESPAVRIQSDLNEWRHPYYLVLGEREQRVLTDKDTIIIPYYIESADSICLSRISDKDRDRHRSPRQRDLFLES